MQNDFGKNNLDAFALEQALTNGIDISFRAYLGY